MITNFLFFETFRFLFCNVTKNVSGKPARQKIVSNFNFYYYFTLPFQLGFVVLSVVKKHQNFTNDILNYSLAKTETHWLSVNIALKVVFLCSISSWLLSQFNQQLPTSSIFFVRQKIIGIFIFVSFVVNRRLNKT